jgi:hypothetical protein
MAREIEIQEATSFVRIMTDFGADAERATYIVAAFEQNETDDEAVEYDFGGVDSLNPEQLMMLSEEVTEPDMDLAVDITVPVGGDVVQPNPDPMPRSPTSRRRNRPIAVGRLDSMWREFFAIARFQEARERKLRMQADRRPRLFMTVTEG